MVQTGFNTEGPASAEKEIPNKSSQRCAELREQIVQSHHRVADPHEQTIDRQTSDGDDGEFRKSTRMRHGRLKGIPVVQRVVRDRAYRKPDAAGHDQSR